MKANFRPGRWIGLSLLLLASVVTGLSIVPVAKADDEPIEFLHALQKRGFGEMALEYMQSLERRQQVPPELRETWDLEQSNSLRVSADEALTPELGAKRLIESEKFLDKFLLEKPDHEEVASAMMAWGTFAFNRAMEKFTESKGAERAEATRLAAEAREMFEQTKPRFAKAVERYNQRLANATKALAEKREPARGRAPRRIATKGGPSPLEVAVTDAQYFWLESRFKLALVDYYIGQTYPEPPVKLGADGKPAKPDPKAVLPPEVASRKKAFEAASKGFDDIYQATRTQAGLMVPIMFAHLWHGRCSAELGKYNEALDIFEECQGWDSGRMGPELESFFSQVEYFRLLVVAKRDGPEELVRQATEWRAEKLGKLPAKERERIERMSGFQGVTLELAKAQMALAAKETVASTKNSLLQAALTNLKSAAKVRSDYQSEAILTLRKNSAIFPAGGVVSDNFAEVLVLARDAAQNKQWSDAVGYYTKAVELSAKQKDQKDVPEAKKELAFSNYYLGREMLQAGKHTEALGVARTLLQDANSPVGQHAASLAINASQMLYVKADEAGKKDALDQFQRIAQFAIEKFAGKAVEGEARLALARASLTRGEEAAAITALQGFNPQSPVFGDAMQLLGQIHWRRYVIERLKREEERNQEQMAVDRGAAVKALSDAMGKLFPNGVVAPVPRDQMDVPLLLSEIHLEGNDANAAKAILVPLVESLKAEKQLDGQALRIFVSAVRTHVLLGDFGQASRVAVGLIEKGDDSLQVNNSLIEFVKLVNNEVEKAKAAVTDATTNPDPNVMKAAEAALAARQRLLAGMLSELAKREQLSAQSMVFLANRCIDVNLVPQARALFEQVLQNSKDPALEARVRSDLIGLLRQNGEFDKALVQVDAMITANGKRLEPHMERGRILQSWAEKTNSTEKYDQAIAQWMRLRGMLKGKAAMKNEYYEVLYNMSFCTMKQFEATKDVKKALDCEKVLNSTMVLAPQLSGPAMVAKYNALINQARVAQGKPPIVIKSTPVVAPATTTAGAPNGAAPATGAAPAGTPPAAVAPAPGTGAAAPAGAAATTNVAEKK